MRDPGQAEYIRRSLRNAGIGATVGIALVGGLPTALVIAIITAVATDEQISRLWQSPEEQLQAKADRRAEEVLRRELLRHHLDASQGRLELWLRLAKAWVGLTSSTERPRRRRNRGKE